MKQQLRQLKLFELGIADWPYQTPYEEMKRVVEDNLNGCVIKTSDKYPDSYFYAKKLSSKNYQVVMEQDKKNNRLWIRYNGFWSIFRNQFSLERTDIQAIIKILVEQHLKSKVGTPLIGEFTVFWWVEQHLKSKVGTPLYAYVGVLPIMEQMK